MGKVIFSTWFEGQKKNQSEREAAVSHRCYFLKWKVQYIFQEKTKQFCVWEEPRPRNPYEIPQYWMQTFAWGIPLHGDFFWCRIVCAHWTQPRE